MTTNHQHPSQDEDAALQALDERLWRVGAPMRDRSIATDRFVAQLRALAAQDRLAPPAVPLQEEFTLMNAPQIHVSKHLQSRPSARWRIIVPAVAAVLVIVLASVAVFARRTPPLAATGVYATPTGIRTHFPSGTLQTFSTGRYLIWSLTAGNDGTIWFNATDPQAQRFFNDETQDVVGKITSDGTIQIFPLPTTGLAARELRKSNYPGVADDQGNIWFPVSVPTIAAIGDAYDNERGELAKVSAQGQITIFPLSPPITPNPTMIIPSIVSLTFGSDGKLWFTAQSLYTRYDYHVGNMTPQGQVTWLDVSAFEKQGGIGDLVTGPDGNIWFSATQRIGRMTPKGAITYYQVPSQMGEPGGLTFDGHGHLWFRGGNPNNNNDVHLPESIVRFDLATHRFTAFATPAQAVAIGGPDGTIWFFSVTGAQTAPLYRVAPDGTFSKVPLKDGYYFGAIDGRDGNLWFIEYQQTPDKHITVTTFVNRLTP
jgi:streptogramin lyase